MRTTVVPITQTSLGLQAGRADWDRDLLYASMLRWGNGDVVTAERVMAWRHVVSRAARGASKVGDWNHAWRTSRSRRALRDIGQIVRVEPPRGAAVLYGHIVFPTSRRKLPTVWSTNGVVSRPGPDLSQSARTHERFVRRATAVQCWSEQGRQGLLERARSIDESTVAVIPPLIYVDVPAPSPRAQDDVFALYVGAAGYLKGLDVVIEAARRLPLLRFDIVTASARPADLPSNIVWLGPMRRDAVLQKMTEAAVHVMPSRAESFGGVVVEALACGLAQVVDETGVPAEIMGDAGIKVPGGDAAAVASAVERLAGDEALRHRCRDIAYARYASMYSVEAVGVRLARLIDSV